MQVEPVDASGGVAAPVGGIQGRSCGECGAPLVRKQRRYCSGACRARAYDSQHPRINPPGLEPTSGEGPIKARIRSLLAGDGRNRTGDEIAFELRISSATALRELRKLRHDDGAQVHMQRLHGPSKPAVYWMARVMLLDVSSRLL